MRYFTRGKHIHGNTQKRYGFNFGSDYGITGLLVDLDAQAITGLADGADVTTWSDISGNGNDAAQAVVANKSHFYSNILNGKAVVRFDGTTSFMTFANTSLLKNLPGATIFAVIEHDTSPVATVFQSAFHASVNGSTNSRLYLSQYGDSLDIRGRRLDADTVGGAAGVSSTLFISHFYILDGYLDWTNHTAYLYINGMLVDSSTGLWASGGNSSNTTSDIIEVGAYQGTGYYWDGDMARILIYNNVLTATQIAQIRKKLKEIYDIGIY